MRQQTEAWNIGSHRHVIPIAANPREALCLRSSFQYRVDQYKGIISLTPIADKQLLNSPIIRPEWFFGFVAFIVGFFMTLATPPFQSPDEYEHFFRAFQLSEGRIFAERQGNEVGGNIPVSVVEAAKPFESMRFRPMVKVDRDIVAHLRKKPFSSKPRIWKDFMNTAYFSPVAYAPAVVGIWIARLIGSSALEMMYAARITGLLCWTGLIFTAICLAPVFKWVVVLIGLLPMSIFLAASLSADVMTNGLTMLLTALILRSAFAGEKAFSRSEGALILFVSVFVALTKQVYFPLAALALIIPTGRFGGIKRKTAYLSILAVVTIAVNLIWAWLVRGVVETVSWADPGRQIQFIISHPWEYMKVLAATLSIRWWMYIQWFVGVLGWLDTWLPLWVYPSYVAAMFSVAAMDKGEGRPMHVTERLLLVGICSAVSLLIATSLYISDTSPMSPTIRGIQGRYFIPLAIAGLLALYNRKIIVPERILSIAVMTFCCVVLAVTCWTLMERYYG